jgi:3-oxoacid CoA-transferase B subunit
MSPSERQRLSDEAIAMRAAKEFFDGSVVNLGIGIGGLAADFVPEGRTVLFMSENGILGFGRHLGEDELDQIDIYLIDAQGRFCTPQPGMSFFHHADSFGMIRGKHIDITVLGAYQVSEKGDLANWQDPQGRGMIGGAMDLAVGAKKTIVVMKHVTKEGEARIVKQCSLPLTGKECVSLIVTDLAVIEVMKGKGLLLKEIMPGWTVAEIQALTEPKLMVSEDLREMEL